MEDKEEGFPFPSLHLTLHHRPPHHVRIYLQYAVQADISARTACDQPAQSSRSGPLTFRFTLRSWKSCLVSYWTIRDTMYTRFRKKEYQSGATFHMFDAVRRTCLEWQSSGIFLNEQRATMCACIVYDKVQSSPRTIVASNLDHPLPARCSCFDLED